MASNSPLPQSDDLVATWAFLEEGVDHIMTKLQTGVSYSKVRERNRPDPFRTNDLSSTCHCIQSPTTIVRPPSSQSSLLMVLVQEIAVCHCAALHFVSNACIDRANYVGSDIYNHLTRYFVSHLKSLREV